MWIKNPKDDHYINLDLVTDIRKTLGWPGICFNSSGEGKDGFNFDSYEARDTAWQEIIGSLQRNE